MTECVVYWLYDATCICLQRHGYVGISERWDQRLRRHKSDKRFPKAFGWKILFRGTRYECLAIEEHLRPTWGVGWNRLQGGRAGSRAPKSAETRAKMSAAAKARYADPKEIAMARVYQKGKHDYRGDKNPRFGKPLSDEVKARISGGRKGKGLGNQNWRKRSPYSDEVLRRMSEGSKRRWARHPRPAEDQHHAD